MPFFVQFFVGWLPENALGDFRKMPCVVPRFETVHCTQTTSPCGSVPAFSPVLCLHKSSVDRGPSSPSRLLWHCLSYCFLLLFIMSLSIIIGYEFFRFFVVAGHKVEGLEIQCAQRQLTEPAELLLASTLERRFSSLLHLSYTAVNCCCAGYGWNGSFLEEAVF